MRLRTTNKQDAWNLVNTACYCILVIKGLCSQGAIAPCSCLSKTRKRQDPLDRYQMLLRQRLPGEDKQRTLWRCKTPTPAFFSKKGQSTRICQCVQTTQSQTDVGTSRIRSAPYPGQGLTSTSQASEILGLATQGFHLWKGSKHFETGRIQRLEIQNF